MKVKDSPLDYSLESSEWYPNQQELVQVIFDWYETDKRFLAVVAPTGTGKSLLSIAAQRGLDKRVHTLVSTLRLQDQMRTSYRDAPILKGQANYDCMIVNNLTVQQAPCRVGFKCSLKSECAYFVDRESVYSSMYAVFNYQLYMNMAANSLDYVEPDILFCDEAHLLQGELSKYLTATISDRDIVFQGWQRPRGQGVHAMAQWAEGNMPEVAAELDVVKRQLFAIAGSASGSQVRGSSKQYKRVSSKHNRLIHLNRNLLLMYRAGIDMENGNPWVYDRVGATYQVRPVFVDEYNGAIFGAIPKVVLMSATLGENDLDGMGIEKEDYKMISVGSSYPAERRAISYRPVGLMSAKSEHDLLPIVVREIDDIVSFHVAQGQKGIIHTVSYSRAEDIKKLAATSRYMLTHDAKSKDDVIAAFKSTDEPKVLLSPSIVEGEDFPGDECRYIIWPKIPYKSLGDKVTRERMDYEPDWYTWQAVQDIIQGSGRGMRSQTDTCRIYVLDAALERLIEQHKDEIPDWFMDSLSFEKGT